MLTGFTRGIARLTRAEEGQTFVEYALILAVVVVAVLAGLAWTGLGTAIGIAISQVTTAIGAA